MTHKTRAALLIGTIISTSIWAPIAMAQSTPQATDEVVILSSPFQKSATNVISTTEVISKDALQGTLDQPIGDVLANLPGVDSAGFGPAVGQPSIRGLGGFRIDTMVNGMSVNDIAATGGDHANGLSLFDADRVEVLKGPAALRYGAFATTGVINAFNRHMQLDGDAGSDLLLGYGDAAHETMVAFFTRQGNVAVSAFEQDSDNMRIPTHPESDRLMAAEGETDDDVAQDADDTNTESRGVTASAHFGGGATNLSIMLTSLDREYGVPGHAHADEGGEEGAEEDGEDEGVSIESEQHTVHARLHHTPQNSMFTSIQTDLTISELEQDEIEGGAVGTHFEQDSWHLRTEAKTEFGDWRTLIGLDLRDAELATLAPHGDGPDDIPEPAGEEEHGAYLPSTDLSQSGIFAFGERDTGNWLTELAARFDRVEKKATHEDEPSQKATHNLTNISAGLARRLNDNLLLGGSLSSTERAPSQAELFAEGRHAAVNREEFGDDTLDKETALASEIYLRRSWTDGGVRLAYFNNDYSDFIYLDLRDGTLDEYDYKQQDAEVSGFELQLDNQLKLGTRQLDTTLSYSALSGELSNGNNLPTIPAEKISLDVATDFGSVRLNLSVDHAAAQKDVATNELATDGYTSLDINLGWSPAGYDGLRITAALRNATDEEIRRHISPLKDLLAEAGRDFRINARWAF
ncbi:TonB-dependent receptor [Alphaproteobacteria bacterium]|nr:TonB-dependent receptor [Alphaproteobacteria bacterium]